MLLMDLLGELLIEGQAQILEASLGRLTQVRLRIGRPLRLQFLDGSEISGKTVGVQQLHAIVNRLMENSLYARERELREGYFTAEGGMRVGVCGKINADRRGVESLANIGSICIRIPREIRGCAEPLFQKTAGRPLSSILILSPPGLGKTTMLRDYIRLLSDAGYNIAIADERREIAACLDGIPQLDIGERSDVLDGCPKELALPMLIRSCAPDMVATDEIGCAADARALADAVRCGVAVAATAHAMDIRDALRRKHISRLIRSGIFDWYAVLGDEPGCIKNLRRCADKGFDDA